MSDTATHEERARQVSEALHAWCKSYAVTLLECDDGEVTVFDAPTGTPLFTFDGIGYYETTAEEVEVLPAP